jgi:hypothetical protein
VVFVFSFIAPLSLLLFVVVDPRCCLSTVFLFALLSEPFVALCLLGSEEEVDAASFRPAL